jgi:hypothetical protein
MKMKILAWLIAGTIFAIVAALFVAMATAHVHSPFGPGRAFVIADTSALVVALTSPTAGKAWRRLFVMGGLCALALPLGGIVLTATRVADPSTVSTAGALVIGGGLSIFAGFIGFCLGAILLGLGLASGRDRVERRDAPDAPMIAP